MFSQGWKHVPTCGKIINIYIDCTRCSIAVPNFQVWQLIKAIFVQGDNQQEDLDSDAEVNVDELDSSEEDEDSPMHDLDVQGNIQIPGHGIYKTNNITNFYDY